MPLSPHSSADLTATEVHVTKETLHHVQQHSCTAHCQGQKRQRVSTTSRIPFPIVRGLRWRGDGVLRILRITMMPEKHHSMVTIWGEGGTSFFHSDPTFYRCSLFSSTVYVLNSKTISSPYLKSTILKEHTDSTLCKTQKPSPCLNGQKNQQPLGAI